MGQFTASKWAISQYRNQVKGARLLQRHPLSPYSILSALRDGNPIDMQFREPGFARSCAYRAVAQVADGLRAIGGALDCLGAAVVRVVALAVRFL